MLVINIRLSQQRARVLQHVLNVETKLAHRHIAGG
jgi:hypothetical protein